MNPNYLFNIEYYIMLETRDKLDKEETDKNNKALCEYSFRNSEYKEIIPLTECSFKLKTTYPGLLLGIGNSHNSNSKGEIPEITLGFSIDYVTGLPFISGSTVKGVIRSGFVSYPQLVREIIDMDISDHELAVLEYESFGDFQQGLIRPIPLKERECEQLQSGIDVFFDAIPITAVGINRKQLYGLENITPHKSKDPNYDGLTGLNPLTLLKVIPNVEYLFRFDIKDSSIEGITAEKKRNLYKELLLILGIGAKTNVGFGALVDAGQVEQSEYKWIEVNHRNGQDSLQTIKSQPKNQNAENTGDLDENNKLAGLAQFKAKLGNDSEKKEEGEIDLKAKVTCPNCGALVYKYANNKLPNLKCNKCQKPLNAK